MEQFVVIAEARSGTHFFQSVLNSHPEIHSFGEIFPDLKPTDFHYYWLQRIAEDPENILPHRQEGIFDGYLTWLFREKKGHRAVGLDIKYHHLNWLPAQGVANTLLRRNIKVIHLIRLNRLKLFLSAVLNANKHPLNRGLHTTKPVPAASVRVNTDDMLDYFSAIDSSTEQKRNLFSSATDYLEIYYENCFDTPELNSRTIGSRVLDQVYDFLNIKDRRYDLKTDLIKMNPSRLTDLISNYDEVKSVLVDTQWAIFLDESYGVGGAAGRDGEASSDEKPSAAYIDLSTIRQRLETGGDAGGLEAVVGDMAAAADTMAPEEAFIRLMIELPKAG